MPIPRSAPRFPRSESRTTVIGHRGDPANHPQNSIAGILASADSASMAEIDVRPTADGVLVLSHDPHLAEEAGGHVLVEHSWDELADVDLGGHRLERFDALMREAGEYPLNIEIKNWPSDPDFDPDFAFPLAAAAHARAGDLITCFHWPTVDAIRRAGTAADTGLLVDARWSVAEAAAYARTHGHSTLALHWSLIAADIEATLEATEGLSVTVWTVNDHKLGIALADAGVDGIITDDPAAMVSALQGAR